MSDVKDSWHLNPLMLTKSVAGLVELTNPIGINVIVQFSLQGVK